DGERACATLRVSPKAPANFQRWVKVHDRLKAGEMPPKEKKRPDAAELDTFVRSLAGLLHPQEEPAVKTARATRRRRNRAEYENSVRDLFAAPWLQIRDQLPEDGEAAGF